jgi:hypothetical protein
MSLHFSWKDEMLLRDWAAKSFGEYFGYLLAVFCLSFLHQFLSNLKIKQGSLKKKSLKEVYLKELVSVRIASLNTCIKLLEYLLIIIVVTGNVGYLVSILSGHFLGQVITF